MGKKQEEKEIKLKVDPSIRSGDELVDSYIEALESELTTFEAGSARRLIKSLDNLMDKLSQEVDIISSGEDWDKLTILSDQKDSKIYERIIALFAKVGSFEEVYQSATKMNLEIKEIEEKKDERDKKLSTYEQLIINRKRK